MRRARRMSLACVTKRCARPSRGSHSLAPVEVPRNFCKSWTGVALNFRELRIGEVRRTPLPSTRVYGALSGTGSSPIHRRVVNFIGPGRGRMGRTDQGLLRRIVLRVRR